VFFCGLFSAGILELNRQDAQNANINPERFKANSALPLGKINDYDI